MSGEVDQRESEGSFHENASKHPHIHDSASSKSSRELRIGDWLANRGIVKGSPEDKVEEFLEKKRKTIEIKTMRHVGFSSRRSRESFNSDGNFSSLNISIDSSKLAARRNRAENKLASRFSREFTQLSLIPNRSASNHKLRLFDMCDNIKIPPMSSQKFVGDPVEGKASFSPSKGNFLMHTRQTGL